MGFTCAGVFPDDVYRSVHFPPFFLERRVSGSVPVSGRRPRRRSARLVGHGGARVRMHEKL